MNEFRNAVVPPWRDPCTDPLIGALCERPLPLTFGEVPSSTANQVGMNASLDRTVDYGLTYFVLQFVIDVDTTPLHGGHLDRTILNYMIHLSCQGAKYGLYTPDILGRTSHLHGFMEGCHKKDLSHMGTRKGISHSMKT